MIFPKNSAMGKAGENYFAYWILKNFGWPCRLFDIDIGIDAQIEVLNEDNRPTGNCLPVQIKSTNGNKLKLQVDTGHLITWSGMNEPVLLVLVDLKTDSPNIYFKEIQCEEVQRIIGDAYDKGQDSKNINFSSSDLLTSSLKGRFTSIGYKKLDKVTKKNAEELIDIIDRNRCHFNVESDCWNEFDFCGIEYVNVIRDYNECCYLHEQVVEAVAILPNVTSVCDSITKSLDEFHLFTSGVENLMSTLGKTDERSIHKDELLRYSSLHSSLIKLIQEKI